jgi:glutathione S-transferase
MKIYGSILSPFVGRVVIAARAKGIKHTVSMPEGGMKTPEFLKMNPLGKMPTIKDGATALFESSVIVEYLDAKYKAKRLVPASVKDASKARLVATLFAEYVQGGARPFFTQMDPTKRDQNVIVKAMEDLNKNLDVVEKYIGAPYAAGAKVTIADCYAVPSFHILEWLLPIAGTDLPTLIGGRKKLARYYAKVQKDKLLGPALNEMRAALAAWRAQRAAA